MGNYLLVSHFVVLYLGMLIMSIKKMTGVGDQRTRGAMSISPSALKTIMEEEGVYEA
jgi:hypothetical protein